LCSEFSVSLPDLSDLYQDAINHSGISPLFDTYLPLIAGEKKDTPEIGDAVLIRIHDRPVHIATYIGDNHIINILRNVGSFIQSLHSADLAGRIEGFYHVASYNR
jgi:hypothetical protein